MEAFVEEAATEKECLDKIYGKFGPRAEITSSETIKRRHLLGLIEKKVVRMRFYIPKASSQQSEIPQPITVQTKTSENFIPPDETESKMAIMETAALKTPGIKDRITPYMEKIQQEKKKTHAGSEKTAEASSEELKKLAETVEKLAERITQKSDSSNEHENISKIAELLEDNDFTPKYIRQTKDRIKKEFSLVQLDDFDFMQRKIVEWIAESIKIKNEDFSLEDRGRIISLVGPTGIGKTTSIAKLAAYYVIEVSRKVDKLLNVQIITTDAYRIGAYAQINKYCEHMKIPLAPASTAAELHKYLDLYKESADVICIDTTGRSPSDYAKILEMQEFFEVIDKNLAQTYLAISAVSKAMDIREIIKQYKGFDYTSLIITKLDETATVGSVISVLSECEIPISFITTGQKVPQDLKLASKNFLLKKLKGFSLEYDFFDKNFDDETVISWAKKFW